MCICIDYEMFTKSNITVCKNMILFLMREMILRSG